MFTHEGLLPSALMTSKSIVICAVPNERLHQIRGDTARAEELYKKAAEVDPYHANSIYNYAVLLDSSRRQHEVNVLRLLDSRDYPGCIESVDHATPSALTVTRYLLLMSSTERATKAPARLC